MVKEDSVEGFLIGSSAKTANSTAEKDVSGFSPAKAYDPSPEPDNEVQPKK